MPNATILATVLDAFVQALNSSSLVLQCVENISLLLLSVVTSTDNFFYHKVGFSSFCLFSVLNQLAVVYLLTQSGYVPQSRLEKRGVVMRKRLLKTTLVCGASMVYFYYRHNTYCEPYVYSLFSLCEYVIVLCNMAFHYASIYYDFHSSEMVVTAPSLDVQLPQFARAGYARLQ